MRRAFALAVCLAAVALLLSTNTADGAFCNTNVNTTYPANNNSIYDEDPVFVKSVPNGEMYTIGNEENRIHLLHVYGNNGYDFGYAAGQLLGDMANKTVDGLWTYFVSEVEKEIEKSKYDRKYRLTDDMVDMIATVGLEAALDLQNLEDAPFVDPQVYAELRGMADGAGMDYHKLIRVHLIPEITRAQCSLYGAYGSATLDSKVLQLRALDWNMGTGLQNYPTVTIYHPLNPSLGHGFANVGWAGWTGVLTGMSSNRLGMSEIGISFPGKSFGNESWVGIPFVFLEKKILQYATSVYDAMDMFLTANRTCRLLFGVADGNAKTAREVQYSYDVVNIFNDTDLEPLHWWHPRLQDVVYDGLDWNCPYYQFSLWRQLNYAHGILTPELSISNVTSVVGTGDLHAAVYDLTDNYMYVANARGVNQTGPDEGYARQWVKFNMTYLFDKSYGQ